MGSVVRHVHRFQFPFVDIGDWRIASDVAVCNCGVYRKARLRLKSPLIPAKPLDHD